MNTRFLALGLVLGLTACHSSAVPLASPDQAEFDASLVGTWRQADVSPENTPDELVVRRAGDSAYEIEFLATSVFGAERSATRLQGYMVRIEGVPFLSVREIEPEVSDWIFFRYDIAADELLSIRALKEITGAPEGASSLQDFLRQNLERDEIYTEAAQYRKAAGL